MQVESKHSSDICNLSNAILHCEALRTHTADAVGIDNVMTALVKRYLQFFHFRKYYNPAISYRCISSRLHFKEMCLFLESGKITSSMIYYYY